MTGMALGGGAQEEEEGPKGTMDGATTPPPKAEPVKISLDSLVSKPPAGTDSLASTTTTGERLQMFVQVWACLTASLTQLAVASAYTFSGVTILQLTSENSTDLTLDESSSSLFGSLVNMGAIFGSLLSGILMVSVGQRVTILISLPLSLLSWLAVAFADSIPFLLTARFFLGVISGLLEVTPYSYVAEISHEKYRGTMSGIIDVMRGVGTFFIFGIGTLDLTWREIAFVVAFVTNVPPFIGLLFFHDSPRWLAGRGNFEKSLKSLQFFRGPKYSIDNEFTNIMAQVKESSSSKNGVLVQLKHFVDPSIRKRFAILFLLSVLWQWGGSSAIMSYTTLIFNESNSCSSPNVCSLLVGAGRTIGGIVYFLSSDYVGRRFGFIMSSLVCSVCLLALGIYLYLVTELGYGEEFVSATSWLPLVSITVFVISVASIVAIQALLPSEILPLSFRLMGKSINSIFSYCISFSVIQTFLPLKNILGLHGIFWLYAFCMASSSLVPLLLLPETKGKTLEEIENIYQGFKIMGQPAKES